VTDEEIWMAFYTNAGALKALAPSATPENVVGRTVTILVHKLVAFWKRHKDKLIPVLSQLAVAALESLAGNEAAIDSINPPGPQ